MFLAECGIARVDTLEGLDRGLSAAGARVPAAARGARPAVAVAYDNCSRATMVDPLATRGIALEPPTPQTLSRASRQATGVDVVLA